MSPVSRRRKTKKSRPVPRQARGADHIAADPVPAGKPWDPAEEAVALIRAMGTLTGESDPLPAEIIGATALALGELAAPHLTRGLIARAASDDPALTSSLLLAMDALNGRETRVEPGSPRWVAELAEAPRIVRCTAYEADDHSFTFLLSVFERAGRHHGFLVNVDHDDCDAAADVLFLPEQVLHRVDSLIPQGDVVTVEDIEPADLRWRADRALAARATHDEDHSYADRMRDVGDDEGPGYAVYARLLRARLATLPDPGPPAPHGPDPERTRLLHAYDQIDELFGPAGPKVPTQRRKDTILQVRVTLLETRPPIWRRLEVPGDATLAALHEIIQIAFGWEDVHLHTFDTTQGEFGPEDDPDLEMRSEATVTLTEVAPAGGDKLRYTYDFGDNWIHEIIIEKSTDRQLGPYPRCTGGRRAAPPEDCGGVWGYERLVEILSDPAHPEHADHLKWMGLTSASDFDPARFDADTITQRLAGQAPLRSAAE